MKKIFLIIGLMFLTINSASSDHKKQEFNNFLFYQQLIDTTDNSQYLLTPTTKFFDPSIPDIYTEVKCKLLTNEENFIKMLCNDCTDINCKEHQERINTFEIMPYNERDNKYYIKHLIFDTHNNIKLRENLLKSDGLITVAPSE